MVERRRGVSIHNTHLPCPLLEGLDRVKGEGSRNSNTYQIGIFSAFVEERGCHTVINRSVWFSIEHGQDQDCEPIENLPRIS